MRVQFEATLDDFVDVTRRSMPRFTKQKVRTWMNHLNASMFVGIAAIALTLRVFRGNVLVHLFVGLGAAVVSLVFLGVATPRLRDAKLRWYWARVLGSKSPVLIEVEVTSEGVSFRQSGTRTLHEWSSVERIDEEPDCICFRYRGGLVGVVRDRAFDSEAQKQQFIKEARTYLEFAQGEMRDG